MTPSWIRREGTVDKPLARLGRALFVASIVAALSGCGGSGPLTTPTPTAAVTPAPTPAPTPTPGPTATPAPTPTPEPTPTPTPTAVPATPTPTPAPTPTLPPLPGAPGNLNWWLPCQETAAGCGDWGTDPIAVSWTRASGIVSGYRLYYTPGSATHCPTVWTASGSRRLIGTFGVTARGWVGHVRPWGGQVTVVAFNAAGESAPSSVAPIDPTEWFCP